MSLKVLRQEVLLSKRDRSLYKTTGKVVIGLPVYLSPCGTKNPFMALLAGISLSRRSICPNKRPYGFVELADCGFEDDETGLSLTIERKKKSMAQC